MKLSHYGVVLFLSPYRPVLVCNDELQRMDVPDFPWQRAINTLIYLNAWGCSIEKVR